MVQQQKNTKTASQDALQKSEYWVFMAEPVFLEVETEGAVFKVRVNAA